MANISHGVGQTPKSQTPKTRLGEAIDQAAGAARGAIPPNTRELYEELDPDALTARLRGAVDACPTASLLAAASVSYLRTRLLNE